MWKVFFAVGAVVVGLIGAPLTAYADTGSNPSDNDCLGVERQTRNSNGGSGQHGQFGPAQSVFVKDHQPYGQWLNNTWKPRNCP